MRLLPSLLVALACAAAAVPAAAAHCEWSGMHFAPFVPQTDLQVLEHQLIKGCDDPRLDEERRGHCLLCAKQTTRDGCLAAKAQHWHGYADVESCAWETRDELGQTVHEIRFKLGINVPFMFSSRIRNDTVCATRREYTVHSKGYRTAYFSVYGDGTLPNGQPLPNGLRPDASCVVQAPAKTCRLLFHHSPEMQWEISSRDIWTVDPRIVRRLNDSRNADCLAGADRKCIAADPPFEYSVKVTAIPCGKKEGGWRHDPTIQCGGQVPMGQPGYLLYPEAIRTTHREVVWGLQGLRSMRWNVSSDVPLASMVMTKKREEAICAPWADSKVCDFKAAMRYAVNGTACYGKRCSGRVTKRAAQEYVFVLAYPKFTAAEREILSETPPTLATVDLHGER